MVEPDVLTSLSSKYGWVGVLCFLAMNLMLNVIKFLWRFVEKKQSVSEQTLHKLHNAMENLRRAFEDLTKRLADLEKNPAFTDIPKMKVDMTRYYNGLKFLAGNKWSEIRTKIMED